MALSTLDIEMGGLANTGRKSRFLKANILKFLANIFESKLYPIFSGHKKQLLMQKHFSSIKICS